MPNLTKLLFGEILPENIYVKNVKETEIIYI